MIFLIIIFSIFQQQTVTVYQRTSAHENLYDFERAFISDIVGLYNSKNSNKLVVEFEFKPNYKQIFHLLQNKNDTSCAISAITWTKKREETYDFSIPYMPIREVVMGLTRYNFATDFKKNYTVLYKENTMHQTGAISFAKKYKLPVRPYDERYNVVDILDSNTIYVGDISDTWFEDKLKTLLELKGSKVSYYSIMFPKGSTLKNKLDPFIKYYRKSSKYYALLKRFFGKEIVQYFRQFQK